MYDQVLDFHVNKIGDPPRPPIMWMSDKRQAFRLKWLREEVNELADAYADQDMAKVADGLGDVLYVAIGTAIAHGLPIEEIVAEIHRSNMTKTMDGIGEDAKATKGLDYEPPRIAQILADHGWEES